MAKIIFLSDIYSENHEEAVPSINDENYVEEIKKITEHSGQQRRFFMDKFNKYTFWSRYAAPYVLASSIEENIPGYTTLVIDYFTKLENGGIDYIKKFITDETEYLALSITFLQNPHNPSLNVFNLWHPTAEPLIEWFEEIKKIKPDIKIMIGGWILDSMYKTYVLRERPIPKTLEYVDYAFVGYGEQTIIDILNGDESNVKEINGVKWVVEKQKAGKGAVVIQNKWGKDNAIQWGEWLPLEVSKGCRFNCKFCFYDHSGTVIKGEECLRKELLYNYENFGTQGYLLTDDTVNDSPEKIDMMHRVIKSLPFDVEWIAYTRPDMFHRYPEMYDKMLDMGCRGMFLGVETMSHEAGKIAGKGLHPDKIKEIITWLKDKGGDEVFVLASYIIGLVGETKESLDETLDWLKNQRSLDKALYEILYVSDDLDMFGNDFSSNHDKFGLKVEFKPEYNWSHPTMTYGEAKQYAKIWEEELADHPMTLFERHGIFDTNFWAYPRIRTLGYDHYEAMRIMKARFIDSDVYDRNVEYIDNYHKNLLDIHNGV